MALDQGPGAAECFVCPPGVSPEHLSHGQLLKQQEGAMGQLYAALGVTELDEPALLERFVLPRFPPLPPPQQAAALWSPPPLLSWSDLHDPVGAAEAEECPYDYLSQREWVAIRERGGVEAELDGSLDLFCRLCRYFRGEHPIEEILWLEGVSRARIEELIDLWSPLLVVVQF